MAGFSFDCAGRVALVTGASSGIGRRFATVLAASGARVVLAARRAALLDDVKDEIAAVGGQALAVTMDVTDAASTIAAYDAAAEAFGAIDTVVVNAGTAFGGSALGLPLDRVEQTIAVNLRGAVLTATEGARRMIAAGSPETGRGRIVFISSITADFVAPGTAIYAATKAGITQYARVLAKELAARGVNVNSISPGYMLTDLNADLWQSPHGAALMARFARPRLMRPDALDPMLLWLCSDVSAAVTGSDFVIDDGQTL